MYSDVQCMVLIWLSRQEGHAQPPLDPSEWICCIVLTPASLNLPLLPRQYGGHMGTPPSHSNSFDFPQYPSFSLGDTVVCGLFCRFQLWCSVSRVETVVQQPAQQKEASSRPFAVPKRCQDASWGRKQCISQLAPLHVLLSRPKVLGRNLRAWKWADTPWQLSRRPVAKTLPEGFWVIWMNLIELCTA